MRAFAALACVAVACQPPVPPARAAALIVISASPAVAVPANPLQGALARVEVRDAANTLMQGQHVSLSLRGDGVFCSPDPCQGDTASDGAFVARIAATRPGRKSLTATSGKLTAELSLDFVPAAPDRAASSFTLDAARAALGAEVHGVLTLRDAFGNAVPGVTVIFDGDGLTLSPVTGTTSAEGAATVSIRGAGPGVKTVRATAGGLALPASVEFVQRPPSAALSTLQVAPARVAADGDAAATLTLVLRDDQGGPVPGRGVTFSASGVADLQPAQGTTDANGALTAQVRSTHMGTQTVTAATAGVALTAAVEFADLPSAVKSGFGCDKPRALADGADAVTCTLTLRSASGAAVAGAPVSFSASGGANTLTPSSGTTGAAGSLALRLSAAAPDVPKAITAQTPAGPLRASAIFYLPWEAAPGWDPSRTVLYIAVDPTNANLILVRDYDGLWRSNDGGRSFAQVLRSPAVYRVAFDANGNTVYASGFERFWRSDDRGATWFYNATLTQFSSQNLYGLDVSRQAVQRVFVAASNGTFFSTDGGLTFSLFKTDGNPGAAIACAPTDDRFIYRAESDGTIVASHDGGATWLQPTTAGPISDLIVSARDPYEAWAARPAALMHTIDGGANWASVLVPDGAIEWAAASTASAPRIFAAGQSGVWRSADGGATWAVGAGLPSRHFFAVAGAASDPLVVYAGGAGTGLMRSFSAGE